MPLDLEPKRVVSDRAHSYRLITRLLSVLVVLLIVVLFASARNWISGELGSLAMFLLPLTILAACWSGLTTRARTLADREMESGRAMIVAIAAWLGRQDDATLEQIARSGGPAAESARMILQGRKRRPQHRGTPG